MCFNMKLMGFALALFGMTLSATASATNASAAQRYVDRIYTDLPSDRFDFRKIRYSQALAALIDSDAAVPEGYVGVLDFDPFCGCQDFSPDYAFTSHAAVTPTGVTVTVALTNGARRRFKIDLVDSRLGWIVADIHSPDVPSLLAFMRANVSMVSRK